MGKYLKKFGTHTEYEEARQNLILPNVSLCEQENEVHYNTIAIMTVRYNVTDASNPTQLYFYMSQEGITVNGALMFDKAVIDGTEVSIADIDNAQGTYQFSAGEHTVKYTLKSPTFIGAEVDEESGVPTKFGAIFIFCESIVSVEIPNSVTVIGDNAFDGCRSLSSITMPNSVTVIGDNAFGGCRSLSSITMPNSVTTIGETVFSNCTSLTSVTIPNSVTTIGDEAFSECTSLTSVTIGNGLITVGNAVFINCFSLTNVFVNSNIALGWFNGSNSLLEATIGSDVTDINEESLCYCHSLASITVLSTIPPTLGVRAFEDTNNCPIYVPSTSVDTYKAAENWSNFASRIQAIP